MSTKFSLLWTAVLCTVSIDSSLANPVGGSVVGGAANATIAGSGTPLTTINQTANRVIINWQDFSIRAGEVTRFVQPSASATALNRILSGNPSEIYGTLHANGSVFVINPNGILVGKGGQIDTKSFTASTLNVPDASFLSGANLTLSGNSTAAIRNEGTIRALGGNVYLIAHTVENSGTIQAPQGTVGLAAGSEVRLVQSGNERISVLAGNSAGAGTDKGVNNVGTVEAASAELKAAGGNIYALAINNGGVVRATTVVNENGRIFLRANGGNIQNSGTLSANNANGSGGTVVVDGGHNAAAPSTVVNSGTITARGEAPGAKGGEVQVLGDNVKLSGNALVDVSGDSGGGSALIGGDQHGANAAIRNAQTTTVDSDAQIRADATHTGDGGKVVVWSDDTTRFNGNIFARPLGAIGHGGFAEISGKQHLLVNGHAFLSGANPGQKGNLLLDPGSVTIKHEASGNNPPNGTLDTFFDDWVVNQLNAADLTISTGASGNSAVEDLTLQTGANVSWNSTHDLTLIGNHSLTLQSGTTIANSGSGGLSLQSGAGPITLAGTVNMGNSGSDVTIAAAGAVAFNGATTVKGDLNVTAGGPITQTAAITANGGAKTATFSAGSANDITLNNVNNDFTKVAITSGRTVQIVDANSLVLGSSTATSLSAEARGSSPGDGISFAAGTTINANTQLYKAGNGSGSGTKGSVDLITGTPQFRNTSGGAGLTSFTYEQDDNIDDGSGTPPLPAASQFGGTAPASYTIQSDNGGVVLTSGSSAKVAGSGLTIVAAADITLNGSFSGSSLTVHSGTDGSGNIGFGANVIISADKQVYQAGNGAGSSSAGLTGNTPHFRNTLDNGAPSEFTYEQDASIPNTAIPADTQFSKLGVTPPLPALYTIQSDNGNVTLPAMTLPGVLQVSAKGTIGQIGALDVAGIASFTGLGSGSGGNITLNNINNDFGSLALSSPAGAAVAVTEASATALENVDVNGTLAVTSGGDITQISGKTVTVGGLATFTAPAGQSVLLGNAGNNFSGPVGFVGLLGNLQNVTLSDISGLTLQTLSIDGILSIDAGGAIDQSAALNVGGLASFLSSGNLANGNITLNDPANNFGSVALSSANGTSVSLREGSATALDTVAVNAGTLTVNSAGAISQEGGKTVTAGGLASFNSSGSGAAGNITLNNVGNNFGSIGLSSLAGAAVAVTEGSATALDTVAVNAGALTVNSAGAISQVASKTVTAGGLASFNSSGSGAAGNITLNNVGNNFGSIGLSSLAGAAVAVTEGSATALDTVAVNAGALTVNSGGAISQVGGKTVTAGGLASFSSSGSAANGDITLNSAGNNFGSIALSSASGTAVSVTEGSDTALDAVNVGGTLGVTSGGDISQVSGKTVIAGNTATFTAPGGKSISLGNAGNTFNGPVVNFLSSGPGNLLNVAILDTTAFTVPGLTIDGNLSVNSGGAITESGALIVNGAGKTATFAAGSGNNITLDTQNNDFTTVAISSGNDVKVKDVNAINFGASTVSGNLNVTAAGAITESGILTVNGAGKVATFDAGLGNNIFLDTQNNDFDTVVINSGNFVALKDANALNIGNVTVVANLGITAGGKVDFKGAGPSLVFGNLGVTSASGGIDDSGSGSLTVFGTSTLDAGAANNITLDNANNDFSTVVVASGKDVTLRDISSMNLGNLAVSGNLGVTAGGLVDFVGAGASSIGGSVGITSQGINDSGFGTLAVNGTTTLDAGTANNITLDNNNDFDTVAITSGKDVVLRDVNAIRLGLSSISGTLGVTAGGNITESGPLSVTAGASTFTIDGVNADVLLGDQNHFAAQPVTINSINGGTVHDVNFRNVDGGGALALSLPSALNNLTLRLDAAGVNLQTLNLSGNLDVNAAGLVDFVGAGASTIAGSMAITTTAGGIVQSGSGSLAVSGASTLDAGSGNNIALNNNNDFSTVVVTSGRDVTLRDVNAINLGNLGVSGNLGVTAGGLLDFTGAGASTVAGNLSLTAAGIDDSGSGTLAVSGTSFLDAGPGNNITLNNNNDFNTVVINNALNANLKDQNGINLGNLLLNGSLDITAGGKVDFTGAGLSLVFGALNVATATGGIDDSGPGGLVVFGPSTLTAGAANNITLDNANNDFNTVVVASGKDVTLRDINSINLGNVAVSGNLGVTAGGLLDFTGAGASTVAGTLGITSAGINDSGSGTLAVNGITTLAAGGANITLDNNNDFSTVVVSSGNNVNLVDQNAISLGNLAVNGALSVSAGGLIDLTGAGASIVGGNADLKTTAGGITDSGSGALTVFGNTGLDAGAGNNITLNNNNNFNTVSITSGKDVTLNDVDALVVGGNVSGNLGTSSGAGTTFNALGVAGTLNATANGGIGQNGPLNVNGLASFNALGGNIFLNDGGNNFGSIALSSLAGAAVSVTEASDTLLAHVDVGSLTVNSGGGITQVGGQSVTTHGPSTFVANAGQSIDLGNAANLFQGPVAFIGNGGQLQNVTVTDSEAANFDITDVSVVDTLSVNSGGGVTQSGSIVADKLQVTANGPVILDVSQASLAPANNQVNTIAGKVTGTGNSFSFRDLATLNIGTAGGVSGITTDNGNVTLTADNMNILAAIDTGSAITPALRTGDVLLQQITSGRNILLGGKDINALSLTQPELDRITTDQLQVGNTDAGAITGFNSVNRPTTVKDFIAVGNKTTISIASGQIAGLSAVTIPAPRLDTSTFSGGEVTGDDAAKLLPPGAIGTLWLQLRFPPVSEERYRIEDISKWTGGRVAAAGTTTGPQTAK